MEKTKDGIESTELGFEMVNNWRYFKHTKGVQFLSITFLEEIFAYVNVLQVVIFNFEFRWYIKK